VYRIENTDFRKDPTVFGSGTSPRALKYRRPLRIISDLVRSLVYFGCIARTKTTRSFAMALPLAIRCSGEKSQGIEDRTSFTRCVYRDVWRKKSCV